MPEEKKASYSSASGHLVLLARWHTYARMARIYEGAYGLFFVKYDGKIDAGSTRAIR